MAEVLRIGQVFGVTLTPWRGRWEARFPGVALEVVAVAVYAFAGSRLGRFTRSPRALRIVDRVSGGALIAAGIALLFARRPASI